jgi:hypothetical protein
MLIVSVLCSICVLLSAAGTVEFMVESSTTEQVLRTLHWKLTLIVCVLC